MGASPASRGSVGLLHGAWLSPAGLGKGDCSPGLGAVGPGTVHSIWFLIPDHSEHDCKSLMACWEQTGDGNHSLCTLLCSTLVPACWVSSGGTGWLLPQTPLCKGSLGQMCLLSSPQPATRQGGLQQESSSYPPAAPCADVPPPRCSCALGLGQLRCTGLQACWGSGWMTR